MVELLILPVVGLGIILGLYELMAIHKDMNFRGSHWVGHGFHAVLFMMVALFAVLNIETFFALANVESWGLPTWMLNPWVFRILVGFVLNIKMHVASALAHGQLAARGMAEHWTHTILISILVIVSPLYWPILEPFLPDWMGGLK
ncbi:hypothetical protein J4436_02780 [Candidatus Woesearchaeota archaeon]|nr:hypothetical protein [Candidatus Woesearchaeota archaeon]